MLHETCFADVNKRVRQDDMMLPYGAAAIYSLKRTKGYFGPCLRVVRSSDSATLDVGFDMDGRVDTVSALAFAGTANLTVSIFYDQSGAGLNATQSTAALQPSFYFDSKIQGLQTITFSYTGAAIGTAISGKYLTIPSGVSVSNQAFSCAVAYSWGGGSAASNNIIGVGSSIILWGESANTSLLEGNGPIYNTGNKNNFTPRCAQMDVLVHYSDASNITLRMNGNSESTTARTAATLTGGYIGASSVVPYSGQEICAFVIWGRTISTTEAIQIEAEFNRVFKAGTPSQNKVLWNGDSITAYYISGQKLLGLPRQVAALIGQQYDNSNIAIPGQTMATIYSNRAVATARYDASKVKNTHHIFAGTNDLDGTASGSIVGVGTTIFNSYLLPYIQAMITAGFTKLIVGTMLPRLWVGSGTDSSQKEAERLTYNNLIASNAATYGYSVVDYASLFPTSSTYTTVGTYSEDGVHPTILSVSMMASLLAPILSQW